MTLRRSVWCRSQHTSAVNRAFRSHGVKFRVAEFVSQPVSLSLVQGLLSEVGFAPSAASFEHVYGPTLPVISRSYVDTEFHGSLNSPVVNFADSNESLGTVASYATRPRSRFSSVIQPPVFSKLGAYKNSLPRLTIPFSHPAFM